VLVTGRHSLACTQMVQHLDLSMGNHTMTDDFFVMDLENTGIVMGVQWLSTLGTISQDYQKMKMEFRIAGGKRVVLRGMTTNAPRMLQHNRWRWCWDMVVCIAQQLESHNH
jgi:hypothetical protein